MTNRDSSMVITDLDEDESRLYIDENVLHSVPQSTKSINTGNPFELDRIFIENFNRYQTRSSQTILTSNTNLFPQRHRSTICEAEYFATSIQETSTDNNENEERIPIRKKQNTYSLD